MRRTAKSTPLNAVDTMIAAIPEDVIKSLSFGVKDQTDLKTVITGLKKRIIESALDGEMNHHLVQDLYATSGDTNNIRYGYSDKIVKTDDGDIAINVSRDRLAAFEPVLIQKYKRRLEGIDDTVLALYARGMSVRDIRGVLQELYKQDLSEDLISSITDSVSDEVKEWQNRPLDSCYPIVYLDCLVVKVGINL